MSVRQYILFLLYGTAISWCAWLITLFSIDPVTASGVGQAAFHLTLFAGLTGTVSAISTIVRVRRKNPYTLENLVKISLRQGLFIAVLLELTLLLMHNGWLTWWSAILLIVLIGLLESIFLSLAHKKA
jgi:Ca2+/Na+ antiporter